MKEQLKAFLTLEGYSPITSNLPEFLVFLKKEYRHVTVIFVMELEYDSTCTAERYRTVWDSAYKLLEKNGLTDMHIITLVISSNVEHALEISKGDKYAWVINRDEKNLIISEGKTIDFYGMKSTLERFLQNPESASRRIMDIEEQVIQTINEKQKELRKKIYVPWVAFSLIALNVVVYLLCTQTGNLLYNMGELNLKHIVEDGQWYRIFTSMFLHMNLSHLFNNMLILYLLGNMIEKKLGRVQFLMYYLICGFAGALVSLGHKLFSGLEIGSIGASGAVYGIFGIALVIEIFSINWKRFNWSIIYRFLMIFLCIAISFYIDVNASNVDYEAHVGGICTGFLIGLVWCLITHRRIKERKHED